MKESEKRREAESWTDFNTREHEFSSQDDLATADEQEVDFCQGGEGKCLICTCPDATIVVDNKGVERL